MIDDIDDESISKSQKKRDATALQKLGVELIEWSVQKLNELPLSEQLLDAILAAKKIKSNGAKRRQAQYIGKLMRASDIEAIKNAYDEKQHLEQANSASFHEMEVWRDRLSSGDKDAVTAFIDEKKPEDIQKLRQLVQNAVRERTTGLPKGAGRALFRFIRDNE